VGAESLEQNYKILIRPPLYRASSPLRSLSLSLPGNQGCIGSEVADLLEGSLGGETTQAFHSPKPPTFTLFLLSTLLAAADHLHLFPSNLNRAKNGHFPRL
jgi:hypothetical protein